MRTLKFEQLVFALLIILLAGCGGKKRNPLNELTKAEKGSAYYGGTFYYNEVENFRSLYPLNITEVIGYRIANQVYEGLVRLSQQDLGVWPALAEKWDIDSTGTVYTFHLRKGVKFHDDPCFENGEGRKVTARDFKACFDRLCTSDPNNQGFSFFKDRVVGATAYHTSTKEGTPLEGGVSGVTVLDDYTLQITLEKPFASFLYILGMYYTWVFPEEAVEKYGSNKMRTHAVGTGPFKIKEVQEDEAVILVRNENYWDKDRLGNPLPYLDAIKASFMKEQKAELLEFKKGNLDMVYRLPLEMIDDVLDKDGQLSQAYKGYELQNAPALNIHYYGFQHKNDLFSNKKVRQAFNYAIDRKKIVEFTLKGTGIAGLYGIVPPALVGYDSKAIKGYTYDPNKAQKLLAEAGYPNGEGFPEITIQTNSGGGRNEQVAEAIQKMLTENLNVQVSVSILPMAQHYENIETGKTLFWRAAWVADYPDPENFLNLLYSMHVPADLNERSYINSVRYESARFDSLLRQALRTLDEDERNLLYLQADQVAMDDAAIMPIFYEEVHRMLQPYVRNFPQNPMEARTFRDVYFSPEAKEE